MKKEVKMDDAITVIDEKIKDLKDSCDEFKEQLADLKEDMKDDRLKLSIDMMNQYVILTQWSISIIDDQQSMLKSIWYYIEGKEEVKKLPEDSEKDPFLD